LKSDVRSKKKFCTNKKIIEEYFRLVKCKDIEGLKDLFWPDAIVYEPFSKLEQGLRGWSQIEPFLKIAIMANESLLHRILIKEIKNKNNINKDLQIYEENNTNNNDIVEALLTFQKGQTLKAKYKFELSNAFQNINSSENKIRSLHIQFI
jgi:acyl-CoA hydrolase